MSQLLQQLRRSGVVPEQDLEAALRRQQIYGGSLDTVLLELDLVDAETLAAEIAAANGCADAPVALLEPSAEPARARPWDAIPQELLDLGWAMPLRRDGVHIEVVVHPEIPPEPRAELERMVPGLRVFSTCEACLAKLAAERRGSVMPQRYAVLALKWRQSRQRSQPAAPAASPSPTSEPVAAPAPFMAATTNTAPASAPASAPAVPPPVSAPASAPATTARRSAPADTSRYGLPVDDDDEDELPPLEPEPAPVASAPTKPAAAPPPPPAPPTTAPAATDVPVARGVSRAAEPRPSASLRERVAGPRAALAGATQRDEATTALVTAAAQISPRVALFGVKREGLRGLAAAGDIVNITEQLVELSPKIEAAIAGTSRLDRVSDLDLRIAVGQEMAVPCLLLPIKVHDRAVLVLYLDRGGEDFDAEATEVAEDLCETAGRTLEEVLRRLRNEPSAAASKPAPTAKSASPAAPAPTSKPSVPPPPPTSAPASKPAPTSAPVPPPIPTSAPASVPTSAPASAPTFRAPGDSGSFKPPGGFKSLTLNRPPAIKPPKPPSASTSASPSPTSQPPAVPPLPTSQPPVVPPVAPASASNSVPTSTPAVPPVRVPASAPTSAPLDKPPVRFKPSSEPPTRPGLSALSSPLGDAGSVRGRIVIDDDDERAATSDRAAVDVEAIDSAILAAMRGGGQALQHLRSLGEPAYRRILRQFPGELDVHRRDLDALPPLPAHGALIRLALDLPELGSYLIELVDHPNPTVRFYVAFVFMELRHPRAIAALGELAFDPDADVRAIAMRVLETYSGEPGFTDAIALIRRELDSPNRTRQLHATRAVGTVRDIAAVAKLIDLLASKERYIQEAALESLCSITGQQLGLKPHRWRSWYADNAHHHRVEWIISSLAHKDLSVRRWAADELRRITGQRINFLAAGSKQEREIGIRKWVEWWTEQGRRELG